MSVENTHFGALGIAEALKNCKNIFFIGIGGISMVSFYMIKNIRNDHFCGLR